MALARAFLTLGLLALFASILPAAPADYVGKRVASIQFEPAEQPVLHGDLTRFVVVKPGEPLRLEDVTKSIENLYGSGRYTNIQAEANLVNGEVVVTFHTVGTFFIGRVDVYGVKDPPNRGQIVSATKLPLGTEFSEGQIKQAVENVQEVLRRNGFYQASVRAETHRDYSVEQIDTTIYIDPGKRAKYDYPTIKGDTGRTEKAIIHTTRWQRLYGLFGWRVVEDATTQTGLDRIRQWYQKHDRLTATAAIDSMTYEGDVNRVKPSLTLNQGPKVSVKTTGTKVGRGKLQQLVPIYQEQAADLDLIVEGQHNIRDFFQARGYFDAGVNYQIKNQPDRSEVIEYEIERGSRYKLVYLNITGNKYFTTETLRERMNVMPSSLIRYRNGRYSESLLKRDVEALKNLYRGNGFRDVQIDTRVLDDYLGKERQIAVFLTVKEGLQSIVTNLDLQGVSESDQKYLLSILHSGEGQPYSDVSVATDEEEILNYFFNNGYPDAHFESTSTPAAANRINLKYVVTLGDQKFVRRVLVSGLQTTNPNLVYDRITLHVGDPLSQSKQIEAQRKLYDLGIFARVDTALQNADGDEAYKYVLYRLEEASKYSVNFGIGAEIAQIGGGTNLNNPGGTTGFSPRFSFGVSRLNFLGLGHTLSLQTRFSNIQQRVLLSYFAPQFVGNPNLNLTLSAIYDNSRNVRTFTAKREEVSAQVGQRLSKAKSIQYRIAYRQVSVSNVAITPSLIPILSQSARIGIASVTYFEDRRDDPTDAHKGRYTSVDVGVATRYLGSQVDFARLLGRNSTYYRIGRDMVLARTTEIGIIEPYEHSDIGIPLPERFFAGGASSHRGFPTNQAGPRDPNTGFPLGGNALLINGVELRFPLIGDNIGGVIFEDAGNVYSRLNDVSLRFHQRDLSDFNYMVHAVGFGVRYKTPVGPVRLDLAYSINPPKFYGCRGTLDQLLQPGFCDINVSPGNFTQQQISHFQFHFNLGQSF